MSSKKELKPKPLKKKEKEAKKEKKSVKKEVKKKVKKSATTTKPSKVSNKKPKVKDIPKKEEDPKLIAINDEFSEEVIEKAEEIEKEYEKEEEEAVRTNEEMMRDAILNPNYTDEERDAILDEVARKNINLVYYAANKVDLYATPFEDVVNAGFEGYAKAFKKLDKETKKPVFSYNPNYINIKTGQPIKFTTYAYHCIIHEIYPVLIGAQKRRAKETPIETPIYEDKQGKDMTLEDIIPDKSKTPAEAMRQEEDNKELYQLLDRLSPIEKYILYVRFGLDRNQVLTQKDVAKYINMSQANISKIERTSIEYLKHIGLKGGYGF